MAYREMMRFEKAHARWKKMVRGHRYVVTCDELRAPRTREGSRQAANDWMEARLREAAREAGTLLPRDEEEAEALRQIEYLDQKIAYAREKAPEEVAGLERARVRTLRGRVVDSDSTGVHEADQPDKDAEEREAAIMAGLTAHGVIIPPGLGPKVCEWISGREAVWADRLGRHRPTPDRSKIGNFMEAFLSEAMRGEKPSTAGELRKYLALIIREAGIWTVDSDIRSVNSETVNKFVDWLFSKDYQPGTHNKILGFFRRFIQRAYQENGMLETLPRNLNLKTHRKRRSNKAVQTFSNIVKQTNRLPPKFRCWVLLALNCGCSNVDLGSLTWANIDIREWRLTRKRVKTETTDIKAPEVTYKLWPETISMLKALPDRSGLIFKTNTGNPMYVSRFEGQKTKTKDLFGSYWQKLDWRKPTFPLGKLRSIASSIIENEPSGKFVSKHSILYNGRTPNTIDERHYVRTRETFLDEALEYLRTELGVHKIRIEPRKEAGVPRTPRNNCNRFTGRITGQRTS